MILIAKAAKGTSWSSRTSEKLKSSNKSLLYHKRKQTSLSGGCQMKVKQESTALDSHSFSENGAVIQPLRSMAGSTYLVSPRSCNRLSKELPPTRSPRSDSAACSHLEKAVDGVEAAGHSPSMKPRHTPTGSSAAVAAPGCSPKV